MTLASWIQRVAMYLGGCGSFAAGALSYIRADLGVDPTDALAIGLADHLHSTIGLASGIMAAAFLSAWSAWNRRWPPPTAFLTMVLVGSLIDVGLYLKLGAMVPLDPLPMLISGILLCSYGSSLIIMSGYGLRIMDLLAVAMVRRLGWSFFWAKMSLEIGIFGTAGLLGGPIGAATWVILLLMGPCIQPCMWLNARLIGLPNHGLKVST